MNMVWKVQMRGVEKGDTTEKLRVSRPIWSGELSCTEK